MVPVRLVYTGLPLSAQNVHQRRCPGVLIVGVAQSGKASLASKLYSTREPAETRSDQQVSGTSPPNTMRLPPRSSASLCQDRTRLLQAPLALDPWRLSYSLSTALCIRVSCLQKLGPKVPGTASARQLTSVSALPTR